MSVDIKDVARIKWGCRRGMLELDVLLLPYFNACYKDSSNEEKTLFVRLLEEADPDIYAWLMGHRTPDDTSFNDIISAIQEHNQKLKVS